MISYPLDFNKPFSIFVDFQKDQIIGIKGFAKDINTKRKGNFGAMPCLKVMSYREIPLSNRDKYLVRLARKHKDHECVRDIYSRAIAELKNNNNNRKRNARY
jgi:hypothetical protein